MPSIGPLELAILLVIVLLIFGPKKLPGLGKSLGTGMREFKDSISGKDDDRDDEPSSIEARREPPVDPAASSQATQAPEPSPLAKRPADPAPPPRDAD